MILVNTAGRLQEDPQELPFQDASTKEEDSQFEAIKKAVVSEIGSRLIFFYLERSVPDLLKKVRRISLSQSLALQQPEI